MKYKYSVGQRVEIACAPVELLHLIGTTGIIKEQTVLFTRNRSSYEFVISMEPAYILEGYELAFYEVWLDPIFKSVSEDEFYLLFKGD